MCHAAGARYARSRQEALPSLGPARSPARVRGCATWALARPGPPRAGGARPREPPGSREGVSQRPLEGPRCGGKARPTPLRPPERRACTMGRGPQHQRASPPGALSGAEERSREAVSGARCPGSCPRMGSVTGSPLIPTPLHSAFSFNLSTSKQLVSLLTRSNTSPLSFPSAVGFCSSNSK